MLMVETFPPSPPESGSKQFMSRSHLLDNSHIPSKPLETPLTTEPSSDKRVEFQPWTTNIVDTFISTPETNNTTTLKLLPPSRECQITGRPILKPYQSTDNILGYDGQQDTSSASVTMLSLLQNLAIGDRSTSIDAYQTMTNLIKVYDEPPEDAVLKKNMQQLQKYIQRDLIVLDQAPEDMPSEERLPLQNLIMSALKVLVTMVWSASYSDYLSDDFRVWSIERTIKVLEQTTVPKAFLLHYVHLLATQNFRAAILLSNSRALRVLEILDQLPQRVSGKAIISERLLVYQRLVDQARSVMQKSADLWARNIITAMAHSFKEIRLNAISVAAKVCNAFPASERIASATRDALAEVASERTLSASITNRLEKMIAAKDEASQIPQIWAAVLLMCSSNQSPIEAWPNLTDWLRVIQRCFNCGDTNVRLHAFSAWNRFIHVVRPLTASDQMLSMLAKPVFAQLGRTALSHPGKGSRQAAISSLYMLLYYSFRPAATPKQYSRMWNELIVRNVTTAFVSKSSANCDVVSRALTELFHHHSRGQKLWNEDRAHHNSTVEATELPMIDAKWTRAHAEPILDLFKVLVIHSSFGADNKISDQACVVQAWRSFLYSVRDTCMNEVVPTAESKKAMTLISVFLSKIYDGNRDHLTAEQAQERVDLLCTVTIDELGPATIFDRLSGSSVHESPRLLFPAVISLLRSQHSGCSFHAQDLKLMQRLAASLDNYLIEVQQGELHEIVPADLASIIRGLTLLLQNGSEQFNLGLLRTLPSGIANVIENSGSKLSEPLACAAARVLIESDATDLQPYDRILAVILGSGGSPTSVLLDTFRNRSQSRKTRSYGPLVLGQLENAVRQASLLPPLSTPTSTSAFVVTKESDGSKADTLPETAHLETEDESPFIVPRAARTTRQPSVANTNFKEHAATVGVFAHSPRRRELQGPYESPKESREKQQSEPSIAFSDVRSSPSKRKSRLRLTDMDAERANTAVRSPRTPTIDRTAEEQDQPPTPTPRARNTRTPIIQPDVLSSPPSVVDASLATEQTTVITSSPIKNQPQLEDAIQLSDVLRDDAAAHVLGSSLEDDSVETPVFGVSLPSNEDFVAQQPQGNANDLPQPIDVIEEAQQDHSSPFSTGDEFDAMAASQLSQDLEQLNHAENARQSQNEFTPTKKRKRASQRTVGRKKRRSSGKEQNASVTASVIDDLEEASNPSTTPQHTLPESVVDEDPDTIVVETFSRRSPQDARHSKKQLIEGRNQNMSPVQPVKSPPRQDRLNSAMHEAAAPAVELNESIGGTADIRDSDEANSLPQQPLVPASSYGSPEVAATPSTEQPQRDGLPSFDMQASLEAVMVKLEGGSKIEGDLATIHAMLFQLGMKATERMQQQQR